MILSVILRADLIFRPSGGLSGYLWRTSLVHPAPITLHFCIIAIGFRNVKCPSLERNGHQHSTMEEKIGQKSKWNFDLILPYPTLVWAIELLQIVVEINGYSLLSFKGWVNFCLPTGRMVTI
jgi:hypothetical protein